MNLVRVSFAGILLIAVLTACAVDIVVPDVDYDVDVTAIGLVEGFDVPPVLTTITVAAGERLWVGVRFNQTPGADLRYVEFESIDATDGLRLEWWTSIAGTRLLVSESPQLFGPSDAVLTAGTNDVVEQRSIAAEWGCLGPCIARPFSVGTAAIRIVNDAASSRTVQFYAYGRAHGDLNEPNDTASNAERIDVTSIGDSFEGALETSGDVDWFVVDCPNTTPLFGVVGFGFDSGFTGGIQLTVFGSGTEQDETIVQGEDTVARFACPVEVRVRAPDGTAGSPAASKYTVTIR